MNNFNKVQLVTVEDDMAGQRIDNFLMARLKGVPRSLVYRIIRKGEVRVNKKRIKPEYKLQAQDAVRIPPVKVPEKDEVTISSAGLNKIQQLEKHIIFENDRVMVINKPSGMAVHGGSGLSFGVIEAMRQLRPQSKFMELVHRLDKDTSGCLLIAKKRSALRFLHEQLRNKKLYKEYVALVDGRWPKRTRVVDAPLDKNHLRSGERIVRVSEAGKPSQTEFSIEQNFARATLVKAMPITGRTHQIRVHAQFAGCPLAGDPKYGNEEFDQFLKATYGFKRLFLHARQLSFKDAPDGKKITVKAEYDDALANLLSALD
ncbi:23S rRNA pseudouridine(955/2504/2580) synthase RluC [Pleionea sp. CnH1-48]|uniref:23S rRNA pseudouridine(955/2504/2580) synthase RluC n=1 Tax=Pleionea sp. CnH1-48 TaxID=2954494 RepID=UPI0020981F2E|nr:23S rRNA pseudouridine(955/2504/2580) synthase RluC [Pleionea sp. CnH1-48]MCO7225859.1 23S rRNA pseudouridine(955/2504/2580) synthase RluC [Pleionea sp. CnH1-48]